MSKYICPRITRHELADQCQELGLRQGDTVMVHAGLRSIGEILGGPDMFIGALRDTVGPSGTLMAYLGCQRPYDDVGRGQYGDEDETFILEHSPPFNPHLARASRDFGAFAEFFRTQPGIMPSMNPGNRMGAQGPLAIYLTENHPMNYGLGEGSPLEKLCKVDGKVLLAGSDLNNVTLLHLAEAKSPVPNKRVVKFKVPLQGELEPEWVDVEEFDSSRGIRDWSDSFFAEIMQKFIAEFHTIHGRIGHAESYVFEAKSLVEFAIPMMVEAAKELDAQAV